ncbi:uncharacterized protein [Henckelia pumila]|uniref:uncharacterized protein n=1 Tax=Henckelia pumila TaxID=405737 RepID=UPI003C6E8393
MNKRNRSNDEMNEFIKQLKSETVNPDYRKFLLSNLRRPQSNYKPQKKENVKRICVKNDDTDEVISDSQYKLFFESLEKYEKSYVLEGKINGAPVCVKYERERRFGGKLEPKGARKMRKDIGRVDGAAADQSPRLPHKQPPVKQLASDNRRNEILKKKPDLRNKGIIKESEVGISKSLRKRMDNLRSCKVSKNMTFVRKENIVTKHHSEPHDSQAELRRADKGKDVAKAHYVPDGGNQYQSPGPRDNVKSENQSKPAGQAQTIKRKEVLKGKNVVLSQHNLDTKKHVYLKPEPKHSSMTKNQVDRVNQVAPSEEEKEFQRKPNLPKVMGGKNVVTYHCVANKKAVRYRDNEPLYPKPSPKKKLEEHHHKDVDQTQPGKKYEAQSQRKLRKVVLGNHEIKVDDAASRNNAAQIENKLLSHKPCVRKNQVTKNFIDQARPKQSSRMTMKEIVIKLDDSDSDVEILGSASFYRAANQRSISSSKKSHKSMMEDDGIELLGKRSLQSVFRRQVMNVLRKPYDKQESKRLQKEFMAGTYVKFHSEVLKKLTTFRQKKGKCLALLRGFFFWVKLGRERPHPEKGGNKWSLPSPSQMVRKQEKFTGLENLRDHDAYNDFVLSGSRGAQLVNMEESHDVDMDYSHFILDILTLDKKFGPVKRRKETSNKVVGNDSDDDCYIEEAKNDPQYEMFLKNLKEHEKSYVFQFERAGSPWAIKYEREISLDEECDSEPERRLRSEIKHDYGLPNRMPHIENQCKHLLRSTSVEMNENLTPRKSKKEVKNLKLEAGKHATSEMVSDLDYLTFLQSSKFVDDYYVCTFGGGTIVYEKVDMENNQEKENSDDEHSSDVEILDASAFYKEGKSKPSVNASPEMMNGNIFRNLSGQTMQSSFRQELVAVLRKPYDKEEHKKLLQEVKIRKPEDRHMDLRGGRERSCATEKIGKSYMDRFPGLRKQLVKFQVDEPKCLNLLRGFFFWLQKFLQEESFEPWMDAECLAISPEVCHPGFSPKRRRKS